jgi:hypothetical protein
VPDTSSPISQGDIFADIPSPVFAFDHHVVKSGAMCRVEDLTGNVQDGMTLLATVEVVKAIVLTQSCDAPRAVNILLAPLNLLAFESTKPDRRWSEIQRLATSLHHPTRVYLPDDPGLKLDRHIAELSEAFTLPRQELERFALNGKRIATLGEEAVAYLSFRIATMFWRLARDDFAWPSKADLQLKEAHLTVDIAKKRATLLELERRFMMAHSSDDDSTDPIEIEERRVEIENLSTELNLTRTAIERFDDEPSSGTPAGPSVGK